MASRRLTEKGAWFKNAAYPYLNTVTCAGHSTLGTGTFPYKHGMILNAWFDRDSGKTMTCTQDASVTEVSRHRHPRHRRQRQEREAAEPRGAAAQATRVAS